MTDVQVCVPTRQQIAATGMTPGMVFIVYFGGGEVSALPTSRVKPWASMQTPHHAKAVLRSAAHQAQQAVNQHVLADADSSGTLILAGPVSCLMACQLVHQ